MDKFWEGFGKFMGWITINIISVVISGYVITVLWGWFIISIFSIQQISIPQAIGFALFVRYFLVKYPETKDNYDAMKEAMKSLGRVILSAIIVLVLGWITLQFI